MIQRERDGEHQSSILKALDPAAPPVLDGVDLVHRKSESPLLPILPPPCPDCVVLHTESAHAEHNVPRATGFVVVSFALIFHLQMKESFNVLCNSVMSPCLQQWPKQLNADISEVDPDYYGGNECVSLPPRLLFGLCTHANDGSHMMTLHCFLGSLTWPKDCVKRDD